MSWAVNEIPSPVPAPKRGPEPIEEIKDAPYFSAVAIQAAIVNKPEPIEEVKTLIADAVAAVPSFAPLLKEVIVSKPEPLDTDVLLKIANNSELAEALAAEGLVIDQDEVARVIDENKKRADLEAALAPTTPIEVLNKVFVEEPAASEPMTELDELRSGINSSFEEVASLLLEHQRQIDEIEARLTNHNARGGHKI